MNFIIAFDFIVSLVLFGLLWYVYVPCIDYLNAIMPTSGVWSTAMFWIFFYILPCVALFGSGIRSVMLYQRKVGY